MIMIINKIMNNYLFNTKYEANNINSENSFPWQVYPRFAISNASRPNPAPGTRTFIFEGSLDNKYLL